MKEIVRNGSLWTCHMVGLDSTNGVYAGNASGSTVDRSAIQWIKLRIGSGEPALTASDYGRIYDAQETNGWWYHFPSLAVNCAGDMVTGFSGSGRTNYIGAFYSFRLANGTVLDEPRQFEPGVIAVNLPPPAFVTRWGDYSATTVDPADDWSFWTVQEFAKPWTNTHQVVQGAWGTTVANLQPNP